MIILLETILLVVTIALITVYSLRKQTFVHLNLNYLDYKIIFITMIIYIIFSTYNLGEVKQYSKPFAAQINSQLIITLDKPQQLNAIYYNTAISDGRYHWIYESDGNDAQLSLFDKNTTSGFPNHFKWNKIDLSKNNAKIKRLVLKFDSPTTQVRQIALFNKYRSYIQNIKIYDNQGIQQTLYSREEPTNYEDTYLSSTYFDEIFYATSAYQLYQGIQPYITEHPQLAMLLIGTGMKTFGNNAFGWRIISTLFATLSLGAIYLLTKKITNQIRLATIAMLLFAFDPLHYVMGRVAFLDGIATFFIIMQYYFLFNYLDLRTSGYRFEHCYRSLFYTGMMFGFGIASKWSALYFATPLVVWIIYCEFIFNQSSVIESIKTISSVILALAILPISIYILSYLPFLASQYDNDIFKFVWRIQVDMYNFQAYALANATHPYASSWLDWPTLLKPMSIFYWSNDSGIANSVVFLPNPTIAILTLPVIVTLLFLTLLNKYNLRAWFIFLAIFAQYLPYAFIHHVMFIYYFYSVMPFLIIGIIYCYQQTFKLAKIPQKYANIILNIYLICAIALFIMFLPATIGIEFPREYVKQYLLWRPSWNF